MRKEFKTEEFSCDLCGSFIGNDISEVTSHKIPYMHSPLIVVQISYHDPKGCFDARDICLHCNQKLSEFLLTNDMIGRALNRHQS